MILRFKEYIEEGAMVQDNSLKQLKRVQKLSKKTDVGNKLKGDASKPALDKKVQTYQDYMKNPDKPKKKKKN
jgi:hypothetical protein